jgi:PAS domain S-box-containing protein
VGGTGRGDSVDPDALLDALPDAVVVVDQSGIIQLVNRAAEGTFCYDRSELTGQSIELLVPEVLHGYHRRHRERYASQPRVRPMGSGLDLRARRKNGTEFAVEIALGPYLTGDRLLTAAVVRDVTRIRREDRLFRTLVEMAPDATLVTDQDGRILLVNGRLEELFGYRRDELVGRNVEILIPDRFVGMHVGYRSGYLSDPKSRPMGSRELIARRKDSSEFPVEISLAPIQTEAGLLVTAAVRDVNERVQLRASEELHRVKDEFFATLSHELRTPLASILGYGELLTEEEEMAPHCREFLDVLMRNAKRELRLVEDLLTLVKVQESGLSLRIGSADMNDLVDGCALSARPRSDELGVQLRVELPSNPVPATVDEQRVSQALDNLISNALKFTPAGGTVTVRLSANGGDLHIDVRDTGQGIDEPDRHRVFERLYRSSKAIRDQIPGAGLGLTIALAVVEAHGGQLSVQQTGPTGTTMRMTLPVTVPDTQLANGSGATA